MSAAQMLTVRVPLTVRKQRGERKLMIAPSSTTSREISAADIVEAILNGRQPEEMMLPALMEPFPMEWSDQRMRFR